MVLLPYPFLIEAMDKLSGVEHAQSINYTGCHKYVPFAGFSNRRQYNV